MASACSRSAAPPSPASSPRSVGARRSAARSGRTGTPRVVRADRAARAVPGRCVSGRAGAAALRAPHSAFGDARVRRARRRLSHAAARRTGSGKPTTAMPRSRKRWSRPAPSSGAIALEQRPQARRSRRRRASSSTSAGAARRREPHARAVRTTRRAALASIDDRRSGGDDDAAARLRTAPARTRRARAPSRTVSRRRRTAGPGRSGEPQRACRPSVRRIDVVLRCDCAACRSTCATGRAAPPIAPRRRSACGCVCASPSSSPRIGAGDRCWRPHRSAPPGGATSTQPHRLRRTAQSLAAARAPVRRATRRGEGGRGTDRGCRGVAATGVGLSCGDRLRHAHRRRRRGRRLELRAPAPASDGPASARASRRGAATSPTAPVASARSSGSSSSAWASRAVLLQGRGDAARRAGWRRAHRSRSVPS